MNESEIGKRLQELRSERGLSQRELARRAGMTHGTVSSIERGRISPSIGTMRQILDCIGVTLSDFFADASQSTSTYFFRRQDLVDVGSGGVQLLQVGRSLKDRPLRVLLEFYPPGTETAPAPYKVVEGAEEGGVIVEGEIEATIGDEVRILRQYDAYLFPTSLPHRLRNISGQRCVIVSAITPPV